MPKIDHDTKEKILRAAEKVFHANGFKGTRTTLIAQEAGISRTMLHYYYSTKEALFQEILNNTMKTVFGHINRIMKSDVSLNDLIDNLVEVISDLLEEKPGLPSFIINIMNETPELAMFLAASEDNVPSQLNELLTTAKKKGEVTEDITGEDLTLNIYMQCAGPYLAKSYIMAKENRNEEQFKAFIKARRNKIKTMIIKSIK